MPAIALCVCTRDRPRRLDRLLAILQRLEPGGLRREDMLLVVCDNRPDGAAAAVCEARRPGLPFPLHLVEEPEPGISFARNRAAEAALGLGARLVAFVDDDDEPRPDWLWRLVAAREGSGADMVFGVWGQPEDLVLPPALARVRFFRPPRLGRLNSYGLPSWAGTFNVLLTRRLIERMGAERPLFRHEFALTGGGDMDLFIRARRAGFGYAVAADSVVYRVWEADRMTLRGVVRRAFRLGCSRVQLAKDHKTPGELRERYGRSARKLAVALARMPTRVARPAKLVEQLANAAGCAGELYAASGGRFLYYRDRGSVRPVRPPPG